jgi:predicted Zn finger-like uncharacterized protein
MQLICPNCDAEYAVDDAAIPPQGRDVQCSACGHAWYQPHPEAEAAAEAEAALFDPPEAGPEPAPAAPAVAAAPPPAAPPHAAPAAPAAPRRAIDENLLAILREEAQREAAQRQRDAARGVEQQPDLGLAPAAPRRAMPVAPPPAPVVEDDAPPPAAAGPARRTLLPDIEEINSTLRAGADPRSAEAEAAPPPEAPRSSGFRAGFVAMVAAAAILAGAYVLAPRIAAQVPAAAPALQRYVAGVDRVRLWIDATLMQVTRALQGAAPGEQG